MRLYRHGRVLVSAFLLLVALLLTGAAIADEKRPVWEILEQSGFLAQIAEIPGMVKAGMQDGLKEAVAIGVDIPEEQQMAMLALVDEYMRPDPIAQDVIARLEAALTDEDIDALLRWSRSDLAKRLSAAEVESASAEAYGRALQLAESLLADAERVAFAKSINALVGATETTVAVHENTQLAVIFMVLAVLAPGEPVNLYAIAQEIESGRPELYAAMEEVSTISFLYTYRDFSLEELEAYQAFLRTPAGMKYTEITTDGLVRGFRTAAIELGNFVLSQEGGQ